MSKEQRYWLENILESGPYVIGIMTFLLVLAFMATALGGEDDPRIEEHNKLTDRLLAIGDEQVMLKRYMAYLDEKEKEDAPNEEIMD